MGRFALFATVTAKPGQRDALLQVLLEASRLPMSGCEMYVVNLSPTNPNAVFVYEIWRSEADHDASLHLESVKALVVRSRPLVESFESVKLQPMGGRGLSGDTSKVNS